MSFTALPLTKKLTLTLETELLTMLPTVNWSTHSRRTAVDEARPTNRDKTFNRSLAFPSVLIRTSTTRIPKLHRAAKSFSQHRLRNKMMTGGFDNGSNVLRWMQELCPSDILPKILSYCGPQCMSVLSKTNRFFRETMQQEGTWMVLCTELGKVSFDYCFSMIPALEDIRRNIFLKTDFSQIPVWASV